MLPDRMEINGRWYVAEDSLPRQAEDEPRELVKALCREYHVDPHAAYRAIDAGELAAVKPRGASRGWRSRRSDFVRWDESRMAARRH